MGSHNVYLTAAEEKLLNKIIEKTEEKEDRTLIPTQYCKEAVIEKLERDKKRFGLED